MHVWLKLATACALTALKLMLLVGCSEKQEKGSPTDRYMNPLKCPLPKAPSMTFYCMYGVGAPAERGYNYLKLETEEVSGVGSPGLMDSGQATAAMNHLSQSACEFGLPGNQGEGEFSCGRGGGDSVPKKNTEKAQCHVDLLIEMDLT